MFYCESQGIFTPSKSFVKKPDGVGRKIRQHGEDRQVIIDAGINMACHERLDNHSSAAFVGFDLGFIQIFFCNGFTGGTKKYAHRNLGFIDIFKSLVGAAGFCENAGLNIVPWIAEGYFQCTLQGGGHVGGQDIGFPGKKRRNKAVPVKIKDLEFYAHPFGHLPGKLNHGTGMVAVFVNKGIGSCSRLNSDPQFTPLHDVGQGS